MQFVYIIYSNNVGKFYVGDTADVENRLILHKSGKFKGAFTKIAQDWRIVLEFECENREDALFLESFIKRMKSRKFIEKITQTPSILYDILEKRD